MNKVSTIVLASTLFLAGCYSEERIHSGGSPKASPFKEGVYKVEIEVPDEQSVTERFEMAKAAIKTLENFDFNAAATGDNAAAESDNESAGEVGFAVSMEYSSFLVFDSGGVVITCAVSGFDDNKRVGELCREKTMSELEARIEGS